MGEFFRPVRRKFGVLLLGLALVVLGLWIRSLTTGDEIAIRRSMGMQTVESGSGSIAWATVTVRADFAQQFNYPQTSWRTSAIGVNNPRYQKGWSRKWRRSWGGIDYGEDTTLFEDRRRLVVPYWSIVLPFTLLSAWLLLGKERKHSSALPNSGDRNSVHR